MSATVWKLENDLCRCCHAEGSFYNIAEPVFNLGTSEIFMDMLKSCFDVEIVPVMELSTAMAICETCVERLRDACTFKKQVLHCEERFKDMYKDIIKGIHPGVQVKQEVAISIEAKGVKQEYAMDDDDDDGYDMKFDDSDDDQPVIKIKVEDSRKTKAKPAKSKAAKPKATKKTAKSTKRPRKSEPDDGNESGVARKEEVPPCNESEVDGEKRYGCGACHKIFKRKSHYTEHYKHSHKRLGTHFTLTKAEDGSDDYNCNTCGKVWKKFMYFRQHFKNVHEKVISGRCDLCKLKLPSVKRAKHMEEVHGIPAPICNICNKKFAFPSMVLRHQKIVHMGEANFECQTCLKRFPTHDRWKRHQIVHSTIREDTCTYCGKSFKWKKSLQAHMRIHLEDRRYACKICGEAFVHSTSLRYHRNKKHPNSI